MTYDEFLNLIIDSPPSAWRRTGGGGPSVFRSDISISMKVRADELEERDFEEDWTKKFADRRAKRYFAEFFYNGQLIFDTMVISVDGGRALLPVPHATNMTVPRRRHRLVATIDRLEGGSQYQDLCDRAGITVVDEDWPED